MDDDLYHNFEDCNSIQGEGPNGQVYNIRKHGSEQFALAQIGVLVAHFLFLLYLNVIEYATFKQFLQGVYISSELRLNLIAFGWCSWNGSLVYPLVHVMQLNLDSDVISNDRTSVSTLDIIAWANVLTIYLSTILYSCKLTPAGEAAIARDEFKLEFTSVIVAGKKHAQSLRTNLQQYTSNIDYATMLERKSLAKGFAVVDNALTLNGTMVLDQLMSLVKRLGQYLWTYGGRKLWKIFTGERQDPTLVYALFLLPAIFWVYMPLNTLGGVDDYCWTVRDMPVDDLITIMIFLPSAASIFMFQVELYKISQWFKQRGKVLKQALGSISTVQGSDACIPFLSFKMPGNLHSWLKLRSHLIHRPDAHNHSRAELGIAFVLLLEVVAMLAFVFSAYQRWETFTFIFAFLVCLVTGFISVTVYSAVEINEVQIQQREELNAQKVDLAFLSRGGHSADEATDEASTRKQEELLEVVVRYLKEKDTPIKVLGVPMTAQVFALLRSYVAAGAATGISFMRGII